MAEKVTKNKIEIPNRNYYDIWHRRWLGLNYTARKSHLSRWRRCFVQSYNCCRRFLYAEYSNCSREHLPRVPAKEINPALRFAPESQETMRSAPGRGVADNGIRKTLIRSLYPIVFSIKASASTTLTYDSNMRPCIQLWWIRIGMLHVCASPYAAGGWFGNTKWCKNLKKWLKPWNMDSEFAAGKLAENYNIKS